MNSKNEKIRLDNEAFQITKKELEQANFIISVYENPVNEVLKLGGLDMIPVAGPMIDSTIKQIFHNF